MGACSLGPTHSAILGAAYRTVNTAVQIGLGLLYCITSTLSPADHALTIVLEFRYERIVNKNKLLQFFIKMYEMSNVLHVNVKFVHLHLHIFHVYNIKYALCRIRRYYVFFCLLLYIQLLIFINVVLSNRL